MTTGNKVYVLPNFRRGLGHYANETDSLKGNEKGGALRSTLNVSTKLSTELPNNGGRRERMISRSFFIAGPEQVKAIDEKAISCRWQRRRVVYQHGLRGILRRRYPLAVYAC